MASYTLHIGIITYSVILASYDENRINHKGHKVHEEEVFINHRPPPCPPPVEDADGLAPKKWTQIKGESSTLNGTGAR
jgi:hypothetical protein